MARLLMILLAIFLPPVAVGLERGLGGSLLLNILLTLLAWLPGAIHALLVVLGSPRPARV
ncbi:MAG: YqaE/Pmp3 family membrane protein [Thermoanaerobaculia bacterium]|nr:YqaE/Pmp3 family membrane protein [Thermoanaerobaculia bacterium]